MNVDQYGCGKALLTEARKMLGGSSEPGTKEKAFALVQKAVKMGEAEGYAILARMYERGIGTNRHLPTATKYYALAAIHGDAQADRTWAWLIALKGILWHRSDPFNRY